LMDWADFLLHVALALVEAYTLAMALPLFLLLPGFFFGWWLAGCILLVMGLSWLLNGRQQIIRSDINPTSDTVSLEQDAEHDKWFFVGGIGLR
jgi:hypothetical protein